MARIAGVDLPREKRVEVGLTYVYGIGRSTAKKIVEEAGVDPNTKVRDLAEGEVAHRQTSIGLFVTDDTYVGSNGYSLRLDGLDAGFNDRARDRAIVMHGAPYVSEEFAAAQGRIGRSWGCPALRTAIASKVINTIRGGGVIFSYYPNQDWLHASKFLNCSST
jgi:hypothetical protein